MTSIIRDLRYVNEDGNVRLTRRMTKDVVPPDPAKIARFFNVNYPYTQPLPIHRTAANTIVCSTCDGGGCYDCTDPA